MRRVHKPERSALGETAAHFSFCKKCNCLQWISYSTSHPKFRNTAASTNYERHLQETGDVKAEPFIFYKNDKLDNAVLARKLDESSADSQVSVLLLLVGSSSYLSLDPENNPRNLELCTTLKQRFPAEAQLALCSIALQHGRRWKTPMPDERSLLQLVQQSSSWSYRHHVTLSLARSNQMKRRLTCKNTLGGMAFPYVVACTHRDVYLMECQKEDLAKKLQKAVDGIEKAALTNHVYHITCYKRKMWEVLATTEKLSQLVIKAKHENSTEGENFWNARKLLIMLIALVVGTALKALLVTTGRVQVMPASAVSGCSERSSSNYLAPC